MTAEDDAQTPDWLSKLRPVFEKGQRVRVRLNGECDYRQTHHYTTWSETRGFNMAMGNMVQSDHQENEGGRPGIIVHVNEVNHPANRQHVYLVKFDVPLGSLVCHERQEMLNYCAEELEPLTGLDYLRDAATVRGLAPRTIGIDPAEPGTDYTVTWPPSAGGRDGEEE